MLERCRSAQERWGGVHEIIDRWLSERQHLLILYFGIRSLQPYSPRNTSVSVKIQAFCQVLMDYISAGHFEVYEQLCREGEAFKDGSQAVFLSLYPRLKKSTDLCLRFNDTHDSAEHCLEKLSELDNDLSLLGESLEERFAIEDHLIEMIHTEHNGKTEVENK